MLYQKSNDPNLSMMAKGHIPVLWHNCQHQGCPAFYHKSKIVAVIWRTIKVIPPPFLVHGNSTSSNSELFKNDETTTYDTSTYTEICQDYGLRICLKMSG